MLTDDGRVACPDLDLGLPQSVAGHIVQVWLARQDRRLYSDLMPPLFGFGVQVRQIRKEMEEGNPRDIWQNPQLMRVL